MIGQEVYAAIDCKALLIRYVARVIACEGVSFVDHGEDYGAVGLTEEEVRQLQAIEAQARAQYPDI